MPKPRVLVIAEAANPEWVSVPLVGWSLANALRDVADVHLVTQVRNRDAILRAGLVEGRDFTAIDSEALARPMHRAASILRMGKGKGWTTSTAINSLVYPYFERLVWQRFGHDIRTGAIDIVHRITPLSPTANSSLAARCRRFGVPFVLGPLNGGVPWPEGFSAERRREREWLSYVRDVYKLSPGRHAMYRATSAVLAGSLHTASEVPAVARDRTIYIPENAIDPARFNLSSLRQDARTGPLRCAFVGRLVPYKGPDMVIEAALPLLKDKRLRLDIVGDGPMLADLRKLAAEAPEGSVTFHGWLAHREVQSVLAQSEVLVFPSIREFGGGVVIEAMALGVVPLVADYAGPGELVGPDTGFKVPVSQRATFVAALRETILRIEGDRARLSELGDRGRRLIQSHFTWQAKAAQVRDVYDWVLGNRDKPAFGFPAESPWRGGSA